MSPRVHLTGLESLDRYDGLYVSPHGEDALVSCAGRMTSEAARGLRLLVVVLFGGAPDAADESPLAADWFHANLPEAPERDGALGRFPAAVDEGAPHDVECVEAASRLLDEIGQRTRARHVYLPLGVGGHADHRLAHEASLRAFHAAAGRDVFLYEERPQVFVPGALRVRLGQIGARLPPAAVHAADGAGLARFLFRFHTAPYVRAHVRGIWERLQCTGHAWREWRRARAWDALKALGPRLQPVLHQPPADDALRRTLEWSAARPSFCGSGEGLVALSGDYARHLGGGGHVERLWLLLPPREDGLLVPHSALAASA